MAKSKFDLGALLAGTGLPSQSPPQTAATAPPEGEPSGTRSNLDTEQIVLIPLELIDPDPVNFYSLDRPAELSRNIELMGLMDPLRVRPLEGRYVVVSGHRRRAALMMIRDGGGPLFQEGGRYAKGVPCIVEYGEASDAMRELRLIYANSATRVMTSAELSRQAERVTELLYQLKEQGVEFPGRMRDHVAEACRVSSSKLARLHAIRENLIPQFLERYDAGTINESVAYRLSQETPGLQWNLDQKLGPAVQEISAETLDACIAQEKKRAEVEDEPEEDGGQPKASAPTEKTECSAIDGLKKYLVGKSDEDKDFQTVMDGIADRLILRSFASRATGPRARLNNIDGLRIDCRNSGQGDGHFDWDGSNKGIRVQLDLGPKIERTWTEVYDALAAIAIARYREKLSMEDPYSELEDDEDEDDGPPRASAPTENEPPRWRTGTPEREGRYLCLVSMSGDDAQLHEQRCDFKDGVWSCFGRGLDELFSVEAWWPLPEKISYKKSADALRLTEVG